MNLNRVPLSRLFFAGRAVAPDIRRERFSVRCVALGATVLLAGGLFGQGNSNSAPGRLSLPDDWSHQHVVFSAPKSPQDAAKLQKDARFLQQQLKRNIAGSRNPNVTNPAAGTNKKPAGPSTPQGDWSVSMGGSSSAHIAPAMFPAKYNFDVNQTPSCANDFVVFGENVAGKQAVKASQT